MHASARSTKNILIWRWWWRTRTPPSGRSSSPLTSWPTSPSGCLWTGSTRDGKKDVLKITLKLDKIETHIKFCKVPTKPVTQPRVSEVIQCVINKSWHHAKSLKYRHELSKFYANQKGEKKLPGTGIGSVWISECYRSRNQINPIRNRVKVKFKAKLDNKYLWPLIEISQAERTPWFEHFTIIMILMILMIMFMMMMLWVYI